ncbi:uncharacterized protein METZ01_LOCUS17280 [marine metagenome]|jgi:hypothetical protein|uniref:Uncharacterized protein n=1 Tax=marine metagenome TaxID=408172 RepID=A0A381PBT1_9ZZZZ|tara:strand:+ start:81 stop:239 length:159 start_codon:yes stop_codon:yes gene_type:complete
METTKYLNERAPAHYNSTPDNRHNMLIVLYVKPWLSGIEQDQPSYFKSLSQA